MVMATALGPTMTIITSMVTIIILTIMQRTAQPTAARAWPACMFLA